MHHRERKSFTLPCGWTLSQSWAALRKAWLGFKIAFGNGDSALMNHYASFITRVQIEMGIQVTDFDSAILDVEQINEISRTCFHKEQLETETETKNELEERSPDYDSMMEKAHTFTNSNSVYIDPPRKIIFDNPKNACRYPPQKENDYLQDKNVNLPTNYSVSNSGNEPQYQEEHEHWDREDDEMDAGAEDPTCYCPPPASGNEPQYQEEHELWDREDDEMDAEEVVVGVDTCRYSENDKSWEIGESEIDGGELLVLVDTCYYKAPLMVLEPQSKEKDESWDTEANEIGNEGRDS